MNLMLDFTIADLTAMAERMERQADLFDQMRRPVLAERARANADRCATAASVRSAFIARRSAA